MRHPAYDVPDAMELLEAVREFLTDELLPGLSGQQAHHTRVAANVLGIVAREIRGRDVDGASYDADLAGLDCRDESDLVHLIRTMPAGGEAFERVRAVLEARTRAKLLVSNPRYLQEGR